MDLQKDAHRMIAFFGNCISTTGMTLLGSDSGRHRRDHVKLFGVAVTRNLLIGALGVFVSIMPNVVKNVTNVN